MVKGFFWEKSPNSIVPSPRRKGKVLTCEGCGLAIGCKSPKMDPTGNGRLGVLVVAEAPGETEDENGIQLIGDAGQLLRERLADLSLDLNEDFWKTNAINCRPPKNREPKPFEIKCCYPRLQQAIERYHPKMVWLMGNHALESYFSNFKFDNLKIGLWRNRCIPDPVNRVWVVPMLHPSFMLRNRGNPNIESAYNRDLRRAVMLMKQGPPRFPRVEKLNCLTNFDQVRNLLKGLLEMPPGTIMIFDYETSGIKPHRKGHVIAAISFAVSRFESYSFPYQYPGVWTDDQLAELKKLWTAVLQNPNLLKVSHNLKFEDGWSRKFFKQVQGWKCCTMNTQHVLDDRTGSAGLKIQAFWRWGIYGYNEPLDPYLHHTNEQGFNRVGEAPLADLLKYNAIDSLLEYWLYEEQQKELSLKSNASLKRATELFHDGILALADMEQDGIKVDTVHYKKESERLGRRIARIEEKLSKSPEAKLFLEKEGRAIDWGSNKDLPTLLFDHLGIKSIKQTEKGNDSTDAEAMEIYKDQVPAINDVVLKRKLEKTKNTYLAQFMREEVDGRIYPIFNLHLARTYRSSSDSPNFQNIPVRNEEAKRSTRTGIIPSSGNRIMEVDYSGLEVHVAACYTMDPVLIDYLTKGGDMHRDQGVELFRLPPDEITKDIRFYCKNNWVFPQFYGSYYVNCAHDLWANVVEKLKTTSGKPVKEHLRDKRLVSYQSFEDQCKRAEQAFWDRFKVFREWQFKTIEFYQRRGYVEMFHGFRRAGLLDRNKIINTPIQGSAFHCLLWSLIQINRIRKTERWTTKIPGQIHDSIFYDLYPPEEQYIVDLVHKITTQDLVKAHPWIIVPMDVEIEMTGIDEAWYYKKPIELKSFLKNNKNVV